jgi:uncharacterized phiE125 gp8 family phage protein
MSLPTNQYDSLTGSWTPQLYPIETRVTVKNIDWPLTLGQVKDFLRVNDSYDDLYLGLLLEGVCEQVERYIGLDTYVRTRQSYWERVGGQVWLPYGPHTTISSVVSVDDEGNETALVLNTDYTVNGMEYKKLSIDSAPNRYLKVTYLSGYASGECPSAIRAAILQEISLQYKNRQDPNTPSRVSVNGLTLEARQLLAPYMRLDL